MLCLSCSVLLLTPLRGMGVAGPSARLVPGLLTAALAAGLGGAPALPGVTGGLLAGLGDISGVLLLLPARDWRLALADLAAFAARAAAASSTSAARTSSTSNYTQSTYKGLVPAGVTQ